MNVILLVSFKRLGLLGDIVKVKPGYARNFLFPKNIALPAFQENINYFENKKRILEEKISKALILAKLRAKEVKKFKNIVLFSKSGSNGKLFGSINSRDISRKFLELGINIKKSEIKLKNKVLKTVGEHFFIFKPHKEVSVQIKILIKSKENT
ncbi:MAG: 50S ribosomal protein L9 [Buchnera aphidicola (Periphyllus lyropictus)]|uniref:50S ribosomal protein L9 n=1 Tax=Buchnera aphidicola TaxID=9 RepID=UPI001ED27653|nr:50S ribosomal protein L9 [Buchnera aphidicola]NIH16858.1 50S ribosomal protein L9 [Buchnera aphidicola (Periphyllus lyropictus)]USS94727.1 50S ribosomal protein L9 [Buchnera aphidicola (Periphyllus lyropictus)]